jgi:nucleotide-binding universal stress UspA family protein
MKPDLAAEVKERAMSKTVLLAVDTSTDVPAATSLIRDLVSNDSDQVIVLHVHEYAVGRFGKIQVDCIDGAGESVVEDAVAKLRESGIAATADVRKTPVGHIARTVIGVADECDARVVVLGSSGSHDLPWLPFGSVSLRLLHLSRRPVLIVPSSPVNAARQPVASAVVS